MPGWITTPTIKPKVTVPKVIAPTNVWGTGGTVMQPTVAPITPPTIAGLAPTPTSKGSWVGDWTGLGVASTPTPVTTTPTPTPTPAPSVVTQSTAKPVTVIPTLDRSQKQMLDLLKKMISDVPSPQQYLEDMQRFIAQAMSGIPGAPPTSPKLGIPDMPVTSKLNISDMPVTPKLDIPDMPSAQTFAEATKGMNLLEAEGPLDAEMIKALREAMSGKVSEEYFQETIVGPATKAFREEIVPTIKEGFVGPGTYWGGERAESVERQGMQLAEAIASVRGTMAQGALERQTTAALGYGELKTSAEGQRLDFASRNYDTWMRAKSEDYATWSRATTTSYNDWLDAKSQDYATWSAATTGSYDTWMKAKSQDYATWSAAAVGSYNDWLDAKSQDYGTWRSGISTDLNTYMQAFIEANPTHADTINSIISYLNVPTLAAFQNPEYIPSAIQKALQGVT